MSSAHLRFQVITLFPELMEQITSHGVLGQARKNSLIDVCVHTPRKHTEDFHKTVDDRPFGGGDGMILLAQPLQKTLCEVMTSESWVVYMSPQGLPLKQNKVVELSKRKDIVLICGRYGGIDQRVINEFVDEEISIGDYVLSGGELAAGVVIDAVTRQIPGVLGHEKSAERDSFSAGLGGLLEAPLFTRPREFHGESVPEILLSGNHAKIEEWRAQVSLLITLLKRPELCLELGLSAREKDRLIKFFQALPQKDRRVLGLSALTESDLERII